MTEVVSFRADDDDIDAIERARVSMGLASRAEAVRELVRRGAARMGSLADEPVFKVRAPKKLRRKRSFTSREIDDFLYRRGS